MIKTSPDSFMKIALLSAMIASAMAFFLFWQNQQLTYQLSVVRQSSPSPRPTNAANSTENWQSYSNERYGFSIKFPGDKNDPYSFSERKYSDHTRIELSNSCFELYVGEKSLVTNNITESIPFKYLSEISQMSIGSEKKYQTTLANNQLAQFSQKRNDNYLLDNTEFTSLSTNTSNPDLVKGSQTILYAYKVNNLYLLRFNTSERCSQSDQILSTFKFTK